MRCDPSRYSEKESKEFLKTGVFNIHPKASIPLGGCFVQEYAVKGTNHVLRITHPDFGGGQLLLAAETEESLLDWKKWITDSGRVCVSSALTTTQRLTQP